MDTFEACVLAAGSAFAIKLPSVYAAATRISILRMDNSTMTTTTTTTAATTLTITEIISVNSCKMHTTVARYFGDRTILNNVQLRRHY